MVNWQIPQGRWHRPLGDQSPWTPPDPAPPAAEDQEAAPMLRFVLYEPATTCAVCARAEDPRPALIQRLAPVAVQHPNPYRTAVMMGQQPRSAYDRHRDDWMRDGQLVDVERMLRHELPPAERPAPPQLPLTRWRVTWSPLGAGQAVMVALYLALLGWAISAHALFMVPVALFGAVAFARRRRP